MSEAKNQSKTVIPGEKIGKTEEYLRGENTFVAGGNIYSEITGRVEVEGRKIFVNPLVSVPPVPKLNDIVVGRVFSIRDTLALIRLEYVEGNERREIPSNEVGALHISNVSEDYVNEMEDVFREGDIVKAKVINPESGNIDLSTSEPDLGVISAKCSKCRTRMHLKENSLKCPDCGKTETRKRSKQYK